MGFSIILFLLLIGIVLLVVEIFFLPGISVAGIAGIFFVGGAVFYAYSYIGLTAGNLTLIGSIILLGLSIWLFIKSKMLDKMALKTEIDAKVDPLKGTNVQVGDKGITISRLAPMGKIKINGSYVEAKTYDDFIDPGVEVVVVEVLNTNVLVERKEVNLN